MAVSPNPDPASSSAAKNSYQIDKSKEVVEKSSCISVPKKNSSQSSPTEARDSRLKNIAAILERSAANKSAAPKKPIVAEELTIPDDTRGAANVVIESIGLIAKKALPAATTSNRAPAPSVNIPISSAGQPPPIEAAPILPRLSAVKRAQDQVAIAQLDKIARLNSAAIAAVVGEGDDLVQQLVNYSTQLSESTVTLLCDKLPTETVDQTVKLLAGKNSTHPNVTALTNALNARWEPFVKQLITLNTPGEIDQAVTTFTTTFPQLSGTLSLNDSKALAQKLAGQITKLSAATVALLSKRVPIEVLDQVIQLIPSKDSADANVVSLTNTFNERWEELKHELSMPKTVHDFQSAFTTLNKMSPSMLESALGDLNIDAVLNLFYNAPEGLPEDKTQVFLKCFKKLYDRFSEKEINSKIEARRYEAEVRVEYSGQRSVNSVTAATIQQRDEVLKEHHHYYREDQKPQ